MYQSFSIIIAISSVTLLELFVFPNNTRDIVPSLILQFSACISIYSLFIMVTSERPRILGLLSSIYMTMFYLVPGLFHLCFDDFPFFSPNYPVAAKTYAAILVLVFSIFFYLAYFLPKGSWKEAQPLAYKYPHRAVYLTILACLAISLGSGFMAGFGQLNLTRIELSSLDTRASPIEVIITNSARIFSFLSLLLATITVRHGTSKTALITTTATLFLFIVTNNPLSIPRFLLASYFIAFCIVHFRITPIRKAYAVIMLFVGQFTVFPLLSYLSRGDITDYVKISPFNYLITSGDFDGFQSTINAVMWIDEAGLQWGRQLISAALFFVPRSVFPQKSIGTGGDAATSLGFPFINISAPLPAEFFVDFGLPGLLFFSFAFGYFLGHLDISFSRKIIVKPEDRFSLIPFAILGGYLFIIFRGALVGVIGPVALSIGASLLVDFILRRATHQTRR